MAERRRITGAHLNLEREKTMTQEKRITNAEFKHTPEFIEACEAAEVKQTTRQASKFRRGVGLAYAAHLRIVQEAKKAELAA
jgi:hypothetical protein